MTTIIWWVRRDLRLTDNQALSTALAHADQVLPVFILDPKLLASSYVGPKRLAFLLGGLRQLNSDLRRGAHPRAVGDAHRHSAGSWLLDRPGLSPADGGSHMGQRAGAGCL